MSDGFKAKIDGKTKDAEKAFLFVEVKVLMLLWLLCFMALQLRLMAGLKVLKILLLFVEVKVLMFFMAVMSDGFEVKVDGRMGIEASLDLCCSSWDGGHSCHVKPELKGFFVFFSHFVFLSLWFCICWCGVRRPKLAAGRSSRGWNFQYCLLQNHWQLQGSCPVDNSRNSISTLYQYIFYYRSPFVPHNSIYL